MALTKVLTGGIALDAVDNTILKLDDDYALTGTVSGTSPLEKIHEVVVTDAVALVAFTSTYITDAYSTYVIYMDGVLHASDNAGLRSLVSIDNGSNFITSRGSSDHLLSGAANTNGGGGNVAFHQIAAAAEDAADSDLNGSLTCYNFRSNTHHKSTHSEVANKHSDAQYHIKYDGYGVHLTDSKINYIKFFGGSNLTAGRFKLFGIKG